MSVTDSPAADEGYGSPRRLSFPEDEAKHSWLSLLLDAYCAADTGVAEGVRRQEKQGRTLACRRGCSACCRTHRTIPVYPLELVGLSWYATEKITGPARDKLETQLRAHSTGDACPFLVEDVCVVHAMRPLACRHFNVLDKVCAEGEDAFYTRRRDVLTPLRRYMDEAIDAMLPFYGLTKKADRRKAIKTGAMHETARVMGELEWTSLADKMNARDGRNPPRQGSDCDSATRSS